MLRTTCVPRLTGVNMVYQTVVSMSTDRILLSKITDLTELV